MFSGIIEELGEVKSLEKEGSNLHIEIKTPLAKEVKIDQSIAHNGACLTVVKFNAESYTVTAIDETLQKTNLGKLKVGDMVNLERCLQVNDRLDGHIVQGHVGTVGEVQQIEEKDGSWYFHFKHAESDDNITVPKGSICVNGVSLTVVNSTASGFSVAIIPYTYEHTTFRHLNIGDWVNLEFDILGKYVSRYMSRLKK